jgi:hypothetical protein
MAIFYSGGEGLRRTLIMQTGFDGTIDGLLFDWLDETIPAPR